MRLIKFGTFFMKLRTFFASKSKGEGQLPPCPPPETALGRFTHETLQISRVSTKPTSALTNAQQNLLSFQLRQSHEIFDKKLCK